MPRLPDLPVTSALPDLRAALAAAGSAVLQAPPGAGKTTLVPPAFLAEPWLAGRRIVMLEPRRLAARAAAHRIAVLLGEQLGQTVGYRVRLDSRVGPDSRIEVVTEGVLTRLLQDDPGLESYGLVIFDEFHERSLAADLGLALTLQTRDLLRPDLRILVMSATLEVGPVAGLLGDAAVITSEGASWPVTVHHAARPVEGRVEAAVAGVVHTALTETSGDLLVFLPGAGEIRRTAQRLEAELPPEVLLAPLHGSLPFEAQDFAIRPAPAGRRKVVLATSIAETSLTIEGIGAVVDSGLARVPRFSPRSGMTRLATIRVSRAAAEQRAGRAGRLGPGVCYRLWTEAEQGGLVPFASPEILEADLAPLALDLAAAGVRDPAELVWLDPPPTAAFAQARQLLTELGAFDLEGRFTAHGRRMAQLGMHPRLAHMVLAAEPLGQTAAAVALAALLTERDPLRSREGLPEADLRLRLELLRRGGGDSSTASPGVSVERAALRRIGAAARQWGDRVNLRVGSLGPEDVEWAGLLLAFAYPDRIAQRRPGGGSRYLLRNGRGAFLAPGDPLGQAPWLVAAELDDQRPEARITLAAPVDPAELEAHFAQQIVREESVVWESGGIRARAVERLGALTLREAPLRDPPAQRLTAALLDGVASEGLDSLPWTDAARRLLQRLRFVALHRPDWPDYSGPALIGSLAEWLGPFLAGVRRRSELASVDLAAALQARLSWEQRRDLDQLAPTHLTVPSGSRVPIDYADSNAPVVAVRLQEVFGLTETPSVAGGQVSLTFHLLSPARRPVQVTRDLAGFWRTTYFEVRKELKGRYPKHAWPEDPLQARPRRGTR